MIIICGLIWLELRKIERTKNYIFKSSYRQLAALAATTKSTRRHEEKKERPFHSVDADCDTKKKNMSNRIIEVSSGYTTADM
jgi:hypothetical protein